MSQRVWPSLLMVVLGVGGGAAGAGLVQVLHPVVEARPAFAEPTANPAPVAPALGGTEVIADLVDRAGPAVVNIDTVSKQTVTSTIMNPFWDPFSFGANGPFQRRQQVVQQKGIGSGFIIRDNGLVVTNNHVVSGASELWVTLPDGHKYKGKVIGTDPLSDLALVKIDANHLPFLKLADAKTLRVGQWTVAIGSPLGLTHSVTAGILSAMDRDLALNNHVGFLQTSTPINPGNSGGPLLNLRGEVIGVNSAVAQNAQGIGFAIPVETVARVIPQLEAHGKVERAWLGVGLRDLPENRQNMFYPADQGALIAQVDPEGPASKAGLREGDVVMELNGKAIKNSHDLMLTVGDMKVGDKAALKVSREGQKKLLDVTLGQLPSKIAQANPEPPQGAPEDGGE